MRSPRSFRSAARGRTANASAADGEPRGKVLMYLIRAYLVAYFVLVAGAVLALWQAGVLSQIPVVWTSLGVLIAVLLGVLLAATSRHPRLPVD